MAQNGKIKIIQGNGNPDLALAIAKKLGVAPIDALLTTFSDGETRVEIKENIRGGDIFLCQSFPSPNVNNLLMETLIAIDAAKRASARRITVVLFYFAYARQDRKVIPRAPITAKLMADILTTAGANRILTMDLHCGQIQGFFNIPVDNLYVSPVMIPYIRENFDGDLAVVSPDAGGVPRARAYAKGLNATLALIDKRRDAPGKAKAMNVLGNVMGKNAFIMDDMCGSFGTLDEATVALLKAGAKSVNAGVTHPIMNGGAYKRLNDSGLETLAVTDTIPLQEQNGKIALLSVANLFGAAILNIHEEKSVSGLFEIPF